MPPGPGHAATDEERLEGFKRRLVMQLGSLGPRHKETAQTIFNVGELQLRLRSFREAEDSLKNCLLIRKHVIGEFTLEASHTLSLLGQVYHAIGESLDPKEQISIEKYMRLAIKHYRKSLVVVEHLKGGMSPDCMMMLHHMAGLCDRIGEHQQALMCKHRCLQIVESVDKHSLKDIENHLNHTHGTVGRQGGAGSEVQGKVVEMEKLINELQSAIKAQANSTEDPDLEAQIEELQEEINEEIEEIEEIIEGTQGAEAAPADLGSHDGSSVYSAGTAGVERTTCVSQSLEKLLHQKDEEMEALGTAGHAEVFELAQGENAREEYHYMSSSSDDDFKPCKTLLQKKQEAQNPHTMLNPDSAALPSEAGSANHSQNGSEYHASAEHSDYSAGGEVSTPGITPNNARNVRRPAHGASTASGPFNVHLRPAKMEQAPHAPSSRAKQWIIQMNRSSTGEELGIAVTRTGVIRLVKPHGLMFLWNEKNPSKAVHEGDRVVQVNEKCDVMHIIEELQEPRVLNITVLRESVEERQSRERSGSNPAPEADKDGRQCAGPECVVS